MTYSKEQRKEINKTLDEYTDKHCLNCYARVCEDGRIHLDDRFTVTDLKAIIKILGLDDK